MSTSPNPWDPESSDLPDVSSKESEKILDDIRYFLRRWPGNISSMLSEHDKHVRLVRVIAGYPEILQGVTPLDAPFETDSRRSFKLVLALDNRISNIGSSSLWTELLEIDSQFPEGEVRRTEQLLAALFLGLGESAPASKKGRPELSRAAQALLAELFSYSKLGDWYRVCNFMRQRSKSMNPNRLEGHDFVTIEFKQIKNWLHDINQYPNRNPSLTQRYLRGGSSILQLEMARGRNWLGLELPAVFFLGQEYREEVDHGSQVGDEPHRLILQRKSSDILIDGGGRVVIKRPPSSNSKQKFLDDTWGVLHGRSVDLFDRIYSIGRKVVELLYDEGTKEFALVRLQRPGGDHRRQQDFGNFLNSFLPLRVIRHHSGLDAISINTFQSLPELCKELKNKEDGFGQSIPGYRGPRLGMHGELGEPSERAQPRRIPPWSESCPRCNEDIPIDKREESQIKKGEGGYCSPHRILHEVGDAQRIRDSSLNQPGFVPGSPDLEFPPRERSVKAIATIDGNSIGWLLNSSRFDEPPELVIEGIRRRSMRFNAHWWIALSEAIAKQNQQVPDRIACWVSAGDDIVLAAYAGTEEKVDDSVESLKEMLQEFSQLLNEDLNIELGANPNGPLATFCASISNRLGDGISGMISQGSDLEIEAKNLWRNSHRDDSAERTMISAEKLGRESFDIHRMLLKGTEWTEDLLRKVAEKHSLNVDDSDDLNKLNVICSRAEIVYTHEGIRILISEKKGSVESLPAHDKMELPSTEAGITNLVLIQSQ